MNPGVLIGSCCEIQVLFPKPIFLPETVDGFKDYSTTNKDNNYPYMLHSNIVYKRLNTHILFQL